MAVSTNRAGYSLIELIFTVGVTTTVLATSTPILLTGLEDARALGAARYVASTLQRARLEAVIRGASTAVRFERTEQAMHTYTDGNGDGVRTRDKIGRAHV